jgi:hypothetical protein
VFAAGFDERTLFMGFGSSARVPFDLDVFVVQPPDVDLPEDHRCILVFLWPVSGRAGARYDEPNMFRILAFQRKSTKHNQPLG